MNNNNSKPLSILQLSCLLTIMVLSCSKAVNSKVKMVEDVSSLFLDLQGDKFPISIQIAHHNFKLAAKMAGCRSWIKEGLCKICDKQGQNCQNNNTCFTSPKDPKISCDTAFCSRNDDFENPAKGMFGIETSMFCTLGGSEQMLMPVVLVTKLSEKTDLMGEFCLMDSESSFNQGLITKSNKKISVFNVLVKPQQQKLMKEYSFSSSQTALMNEDSLFGRGRAIKVINSEEDLYKEINLPKPNGFDLQLSLDQIGITLPKSYLQELENQIINVYFKGNLCRVAGGKVKCNDEISLETITEAILEFQFQDEFSLSLPLHLLFSSCSAKECGVLLGSHNKSNLVVIGTVIWETIGLKWDLDNKKLDVYRLNNQWAAPYKSDKMDFNKKSFLSNMFTFLYHIFLYIVYIVLGLALVSLLLNFAIKWPQFLRYVRGILVRIRRRKERQIGENERDDDYFTGGLFQETEIRQGRRINRLPENLQDD